MSIRKKISEARKGIVPWMAGKKHSESSKLKMRNSTIPLYGKDNPFYKGTFSPEAIEKIRAANIGRKDSEETRNKKSLAKLGNKNPMYGVKRPRVICPHCCKDTDTANAARWHFDKCKSAQY